MNWFTRLFKRDFPFPQKRQLSIDELFKWWGKISDTKWQSECKILVYRMDPALAPFKTLLKLDSLPMNYSQLLAIVEADIMPDAAYWNASGPRPWKAVFCVRVQRIWQSEYGRRTNEVCVSSFEVNR